MYPPIIYPLAPSDPIVGYYTWWIQGNNRLDEREYYVQRHSVVMVDGWGKLTRSCWVFQISDRVLLSSLEIYWLPRWSSDGPTQLQPPIHAPHGTQLSPVLRHLFDLCVFYLYLQPTSNSAHLIFYYSSPVRFTPTPIFCYCFILLMVIWPLSFGLDGSMLQTFVMTHSCLIHIPYCYLISPFTPVKRLLVIARVALVCISGRF